MTHGAHRLAVGVTHDQACTPPLAPDLALTPTVAVATATRTMVDQATTANLPSAVYYLLLLTSYLLLSTTYYYSLPTSCCLLLIACPFTTYCPLTHCYLIDPNPNPNPNPNPTSDTNPTPVPNTSTAHCSLPTPYCPTALLHYRITAGSGTYRPVPTPCSSGNLCEAYPSYQHPLAQAHRSARRHAILPLPYGIHMGSAPLHRHPLLSASAPVLHSSPFTARPSPHPPPFTSPSAHHLTLRPSPHPPHFTSPSALHLTDRPVRTSLR